VNATYRLTRLSKDETVDIADSKLLFHDL
jgi:hypothetical protein